MLALFFMLSTFFINVYNSYSSVIIWIWQKAVKHGANPENNQGIRNYKIIKSDYRILNFRVIMHAVFWTHLFVRESKSSQEDVCSSRSPRLIHPPKAKAREPAATKAWLLRASCIGGSEVTLPVWLSTSITSAWFVGVLLRYPPVAYNFPITQQKVLQVTLLLVNAHWQGVSISWL